MSDGLSVIRRVAAGVPDASPEAAVLTQSLAALGSLPRHEPDDAVVARILSRAAEASDLDGLAAVRGALGLGAVVESVESSVLIQSVQALGSLPISAPEVKRVEAVESEAERATFAAVRAVEAGREGPATPEAELLRQSVEALTSLPAYEPSAAALSAILDHAREASLHPVLVAYGEADGPVTPESVLLEQSREALNTLPRYVPSAASVDAILAAAVTASEAVALPSHHAPRRAADRPAERSRRRVVLWGGMSTLAVAVLAVVSFLQLPGESATEAAAIVAEADRPTPPAAPVDRDSEAAEPEGAGGMPPLVAAVPETQVFQRTAPRGPSAEGFVPVAASRSAVPPPAAAAPARSADPAPEEVAPPEWDAGDELRLLSLRLRQLREQNAGVEWGEPAAAFGAAAEPVGTSAGFQAVREGLPAGAARLRTTPSDTTSRR